MSRQPRAMWPFVLVLGVLFVLSVTAPRGWESAAPRSAPRLQRRPTPPVAEQARRLPWNRPAAAPPVVARPANVQIPRPPVPVRPLEPADVGVLRLQPPAPLAKMEPATVPPPPRVRPTRPSGMVTRQHAQAWIELAMRPLDRRLVNWRIPRVLPKSWSSRLSRSLRASSPESPPPWRPESLLAQLERLECECDAGPWATRAADLVRELSRMSGDPPQRLSQTIDELRALLADAASVPSPKTEANLAADWRRARYALERRLALWDLLATSAPRPLELTATNTAASPERFYLATARPAPAEILRLVEQFEDETLPSQAHALTASCRKLAWATRDGAGWEDWLDNSYRNSNLRVAVSADLVNRLIPEQPVQDAPVRDRILGAITRGRSRTSTRISIRPEPAADRWRLTLEANGDVFARTTSRSGPATFFSDSNGSFAASKVLEIGPSGVLSQPAQATASNSPRLKGIKTEFDSVPLLGALVERIARARHDDSKPAARRIAGRKIRTKVESQLDAEVEARLADARRALQDRVLAPLNQLALEPDVVEMRTTPERLTARLRMAGDDQLAAHTPRPRAPAGSLASIQAHQSLFNNLCEQLHLGGRTLTLPELQAELTQALRLPPDAFREPFPEDMKVTFAADDGLRTRFVDGRLELTMVFAELKRNTRSWRNFTIRVYYEPQSDAAGLRLARSGVVQLTGDGYSGQPQIMLRGFFSKIFAQDRTLELIRFSELPSPLREQLSVTQCEVTDGWIAIALGDRPRTAVRANAYHR